MLLSFNKGRINTDITSIPKTLLAIWPTLALLST